LMPWWRLQKMLEHKNHVKKGGKERVVSQNGLL